MDLEKFRNDVYEMSAKLSKHLKENDVAKLGYVRQQLIEMYQKNLVKINHSILELICATNLISRGYKVEVEKDVQYFHYDNHKNTSVFYDYSYSQYIRNVFLSHMQHISSYLT